MNPSTMKRFFLTLATSVCLAGCVRNYYQPPPVYVLESATNPNWTAEQEARLQNSLRKLEELKKDNEQLSARLRQAEGTAVTETELRALREERDRLRERRDFLVGEINALLIERGNKPLPYTSNSQ